jgi:flagellar protein FlgJ
MAMFMKGLYSQGSPSANSDTKNGDLELKGACEQFESLFLEDLLRIMRESIPKTGLFDGGRGEEIYRSLLDQEMAERMAAAGGVGLARILFERLRMESAKGVE